MSKLAPYHNKLEWLSLSVTYKFVYYLQAMLGAYPYSGVSLGVLLW